MNRSLSRLRYLVPAVLASASAASAKIPVSVLGAWVQDQDSVFREDLARDIGQTLADDTGLLVYDLRKKYGAAIDAGHRQGKLGKAGFLPSLHGGEVAWGLALDCREDRGDFLCALAAWDMKAGVARPMDTARFLSDALARRRKMGQTLARPILTHFFPKRAETPALGVLKLKPPANPAMLVRDDQIVRRGPITEVPLGTTLVLGDVPQPIVISMENMHYALYPNSSYTYMLPKVVQLNHGALGILRGQDSTTVAGRLKQATALDSSNLIWRNLAKVAALDSSNLIWRGLGSVTSFDSGNILLNNMLTRQLGKAAALDSTNLLLKALTGVTALDSTNLLLKTLGQVAALDSTNLVWKGLGQVSSLDTNNIIWRKLALVASLDSNSIWRKLGLLAFQDSTVVMTPSFVAKGMPQAVVVRHEGSVSTMEVVRGGMTAYPLLSSQPPAQIGALRVVRTRGFSLKQERMSPPRGDRILRELESINPARGSRTLAMFLPGRLFSMGSSLRTASRPLQGFIASELRELDMELDLLSSEKEAWSDFGGGVRTGAQESGCYLCDPDRIGP